MVILHCQNMYRTVVMVILHCQNMFWQWFIYIYFSDVSTLFFHGLTPALPTFRLTFTSIRRHLTTHFPVLFPKIKFSKTFGSFPGAPRAFAHHFRIPLLPLRNLKFFPTFLPHFFMVLLRRSRRFNLLLHLYGGTSQHTHFPILFPKIKFLKFFGFLSPGPRGFCPPFSNSPTPATKPQISSDVSTPFLTNFPTSSRLSRFIPGTPRLDETNFTLLVL